MMPVTDKNNRLLSFLWHALYLIGRQLVALGYASVTLQNSVKLVQISMSKNAFVWPTDSADILLLQCKIITLS